MNLQSLKLINFRNYNDIEFFFPSEGAIFEGPNGSGKTNILESIYLLCTGKSQRGSKRSEIINFKESSLFIEGIFDSKNKFTKASMGFSRDKLIVLKINEVVINSFSDWFGKRPIVSFSSEDLQIVKGSPEERRRFIDILCSQIFSDYLYNLIVYRHNLACRNKLLSENFDKLQCEIYEEKMLETGSELYVKRKEMLSYISPHFSDFYREISGNKETATLVYNPSVNCDLVSKSEWKNVFSKMLNERRKSDIEKGFSSVGPHRDDISFFLDNKPAKNFGSQGQCRSIVLSIKLSSVECIEHYRQENMIFLIDDAVSELDKQRTREVYSLLEDKGQVFIATPEYGGQSSKSLKRYLVSDGKVIEI